MPVRSECHICGEEVTRHENRPKRLHTCLACRKAKLSGRWSEDGMRAALRFGKAPWKDGTGSPLINNKPDYRCFPPPRGIS